MSRMVTNEAKSDYFRLARRPPRIAGKLQRSFPDLYKWISDSLKISLLRVDYLSA